MSDLLATPLSPERFSLEPQVTAAARGDREAFARLVEATSGVVVLYYREGQSVRQVAGLLGLSEAAVKQRLARARAQVRQTLLERAAGALRDSAPGAGFTAGVLVALSLAAPSTAMAAGLGVSKLAAGSSWAAKLGGAASAAGGVAIASAVGGFAGAASGVLGGARAMQRQARDEPERRGIRIYARICLLVVGGFGLTTIVSPTKEAASVAFVLMMAIFWVLHFRWLPAVTRRRREAELREDPTAALRHRLTRRRAALGFSAGTVLGALPLIVAWLLRW